MKSSQLVRLQHQFLTSLHRGPSEWLLNEIQPAPGFRDSKEVLELYLHRAMARTIDPLHSVYQCVKWMVGTEKLERLLELFYSQSLGEPLNSEVLAAEFASFLGSLRTSDCSELSVDFLAVPDSGLSAPQALMAAGMLDWRCHWASLSKHDHESSNKKLHKQLHHRSFFGLRPSLDYATKLCLSGVDLVALRELVDSGAPGQAVPTCPEGPSTFLIHSDLNYEVSVRQLTENEARLLQQCDGTHSIASLCHVASFFGDSHDDTRTLIGRLIDEGVVTELHNDLTKN